MLLVIAILGALGLTTVICFLDRVFDRRKTAAREPNPAFEEGRQALERATQALRVRQ